LKQIRPLLLLVILGWGAASAAASSVPHVYQPVLFAQIAATALAFIAPRSLDPVSVRQLALWGLQGMASLDPRLTIEHRKGPADSKAGSLVLLIASTNGTARELFAHPAPADDDAISWGSETSSLTQAAWDMSDPLRRAGQARMVSAYFEEIFTHFDPYSRYVPPIEAAADRIRRNGRGGVGLTVETRSGAFVIAAVQLGGPAAEAGVVVGERILAVDQQTIQGADQQALTALLAGPEGTPVTLTLRGRDGKPRPVAMERALLPPETVSARYQDGMLVIRVTSFAANTAGRIAQEIIRGAGDGISPPPVPVSGIVLDLRGNRGGLLRQAVAAAAMLLSDGTVAITIGRDPAAAHDYRADGRDLSSGLPVVVLVDGGTASSAEILAAALADQRRAVVVGSGTLGKGLVQTLAPLPDGGELVLTWSRVLAPRLWPIQGLGVLPQLCTSLGAAATARQIEQLGEGRQLMAAALLRHRAARPSTPPAEVLDIRAPCPSGEGNVHDLSAARALLVSPSRYAAALLPAAPPPSRLGISAQAARPITQANMKAGSSIAARRRSQDLTSPASVSD
jgi:carboxyl-terminal processing protease